MQMKRCLVVGAGGFGREALAWALATNPSDWRVEGYLDSNPAALEGKNTTLAVLGDPGSWVPAHDEVFISGIGDPAARLRLCGGLVERGATFLTVVHPTAIVLPSAVLGTGCVLAPHAVISTDTILGDFVVVNIGATMGHDSQAGACVTLSPHCDVMGYARVERGCFLGGHACILPSVTVGEFSIVGAGSVVTHKVAPRTTVMGVPAQMLFRHPNVATQNS